MDAKDLETPSPHVTVDLSSIYSSSAQSVMRAFEFAGRRSLRITDTSNSVTAPGKNRWQMPTFAAAVVDGDSVLLKQDGKGLVVRCIEPAGPGWRIEDAARPAHSYDEPNPGMKLLVLEVPVRAGDSLRIAVDIAPAHNRTGPASPWR